MISMLLPATALRSLELIECTPARTSSTSLQPGIHENLWLQGLAVMLIWLVTGLWAANSSILDSLMIKRLIVIPAPKSPTSGSTTLNRQLSLRCCCHPPPSCVKKGPSLQLQRPWGTREIVPPAWPPEHRSGLKTAKSLAATVMALYQL